MDKSKDREGFYTRSPIVYGWVHHPNTIGDPRGRFFVRAGFAKTCALARANHVFCPDKNHPDRKHGYG
jgi:hypothetical protein